MNKDYPKENLYTLEAKDIYAEARKLYDDFFSDQTPINAFRLSITLYHLLEWVIPESNDKKVLEDIRKKTKGTSTESDISREEQLVLDLRKYEYYKVPKSLANNSKHFALSRSSAYKKRTLTGLIADYSVAGKRVGQVNLVVDFKDKKVWIRKVFNFVLTRYSEYFDQEMASGLKGMEPTREQAQGLYRLCYRLTNVIYPGWQYKSIELVRIDGRTGNLYLLAGENLDFEIKPTGGYEP